MESKEWEKLKEDGLRKEIESWNIEKNRQMNVCLPPESEPKIDWEKDGKIPDFPHSPLWEKMITGKQPIYKIYTLSKLLEKEFVEWSCEIHKFTVEFQQEVIYNALDILNNLIKDEDDPDRKELYQEYRKKAKTLEIYSNVPTIKTKYKDLPEMRKAHKVFVENKLIECDIDSWLYWFGGVKCQNPKKIKWSDCMKKSGLIYFLEKLCPEIKKVNERVVKINEIFQPVNGKKIDSNDISPKKPTSKTRDINKIFELVV